MTVTTDHATTGIAQRIDALDLEPIIYKLMHPEPGQSGLSLADADQDAAAYRCFLKLCAWYPEEHIVPSRAIDEVWHTHILDTGKYATDSQQIFGFFLHHFPYFGVRGEQDRNDWQAAYERTRDLFRTHFGIELPAGQAGGACHNGGSDCNDGGSICSNRDCEKSAHDTLTQPRPRPDRRMTAA